MSSLKSKITEYITDYDEPEDWTFLKSNTQYMTHGIHPYPARMIPQVAKKLIDNYCVDKRDLCIDPYCGSGTVLVESKLKGITSIGIDLNPLSVLISKVKTTFLDDDKLYQQQTKLLENIEFDYFNKKDIEIPRIRNIEYWFKPEVSRALSIIKNNIDNIENKDILDFFKVCFSLTVRLVSNTRNHEFKLFRIPDIKLKDYNPNVLNTFSSIVKTNTKLMNNFSKIAKNGSVKTFVLKGDTRKLFEIDHEMIHEECATILVTSPPYGDSRTTVAYGQYSRYSAAWLGFDENEVWQVDKCLLGGKQYIDFGDLESPTLNMIISKILEVDLKRARDVYSFFKDMDLCFAQISKIMKKKSHICYVLGNRTVKRIQIPSDIILIELGKKHGFKHLVTKHRDIPNKHMPIENAPENIASVKGKTMSKENIIIWNY